jgi:hypothetical protein
MPRRRSGDWLEDELWPRITSRATFGATFFWLALWAFLGFEFWIGVGFFFAWGGSVGLFGGKGKRSQHDIEDESDDERGFSARYGGESEASAVLRLRGEPIALNEKPPLLHRQVIADAKTSRAKLEAAASVAEGALGARLRNMVGKVREVEAGLEAEPSRLSDVQRLFTYYLPATEDLLSARGALAGSNDNARMGEIDAMIGKLDTAFSDFADRLKGHDARSLEIDLKLLDRALDEEFVMKTKG